MKKLRYSVIFKCSFVIYEKKLGNTLKFLNEICMLL